MLEINVEFLEFRCTHEGCYVWAQSWEDFVVDEYMYMYIYKIFVYIYIYIHTMEIDMDYAKFRSRNGWWYALAQLW